MVPGLGGPSPAALPEGPHCGRLSAEVETAQGSQFRPESLLSDRGHWGPGRWASRAAALCPAAWPLVDLRLPWPLQRPHPGQWLCSPGAHSGPAGLHAASGLPRPPFLSLLRLPLRAESDAAASPRLPEPPVGAPPWSYPVSVRSSLLGKSAPPHHGAGSLGQPAAGGGGGLLACFVYSLHLCGHSCRGLASFLGAARKQRPERGRATETWVGPAAQEDGEAEAAAGLRPSPPFPACLSPSSERQPTSLGP